ncbi:uncharacterized protein EI90DRAFT_3151867 [Cantharellus anzutake]|uniref:uncharacterized protein n=1 Tax=Cantharellus anzutake TaxID=1750568 RepID=UPI001904E70F|nr:uncharacterized protein EI90DRAFT_3151867 [Cantharellus anzutake]KAF8338054.1 hypothetical protein EI90DRAFT_3151867 [Cantharellus anzutake]
MANLILYILFAGNNAPIHRFIGCFPCGMVSHSNLRRQLTQRMCSSDFFSQIVQASERQAKEAKAVLQECGRQRVWQMQQDIMSRERELSRAGSSAVSTSEHWAHDLLELRYIVY